MEQALRIAAFNMHGFKQGKAFLIDLCGSCDIVCVQEHWLSSCDSNKLDIADSHVIFASFAVDSALSRGVLYGRPFGGLAVYISKLIATCAKLIATTDRYIILDISGVVVCNLYLPCKSTPNFIEIYAQILGEITDVICGTMLTQVIVCGDYNVSFDQRTHLPIMNYIDCSVMIYSWVVLISFYLLMTNFLLDMPMALRSRLLIIF